MPLLKKCYVDQKGLMFMQKVTSKLTFFIYAGNINYYFRFP